MYLLSRGYPTYCNVIIMCWIMSDRLYPRLNTFFKVKDVTTILDNSVLRINVL